MVIDQMLAELHSKIGNIRVELELNGLTAEQKLAIINMYNTMTKDLD